MSEGIPSEPTTPENPLQGITFEEKSESDITEEDITAFKAFLKKESVNTIAFGTSKQKGEDEDHDAKVIDRDTGTAVHVMANIAIGEARKDGRPFRLLLAKDTKGDVVGYYYFSIGNTNEQGVTKINPHIGVSHEMQGKGIGNELLKRTIATLKSIGIKSYTTNARAQVVDMYRKLGIQLEDITSLSGEGYYEPGSSSLRVVLDEKKDSIDTNEVNHSA